MIENKCVYCGNNSLQLFIDMHHSPPSNSYLSAEKLLEEELYYPLKVYVCTECYLVQTKQTASKDVYFNEDYAYFSSMSTSWIEHAKKYSDEIINELKLDAESFVVEIASNDGYLLRNFVKQKIPCLGVEPSKSTSEAAKNIGVETLNLFLTKKNAHQIVKKYGKADLVIANNVYAHIPDINDFTFALKELLSDSGVLTIEYHHILNLLVYQQLDTIYHEHYFYHSLNTTINILKNSGLKVYNARKLNTHGGSLRLYCTHENNNLIRQSTYLKTLIKEELDAGLFDLKTYKDSALNFKNNAVEIHKFLIEQKIQEKIIVGYGAAAKASTILNYLGINDDYIYCIYDKSPKKKNMYLPGSHIPIFDPKEMKNVKPDYVIIFPWNIKDEIISETKALFNEVKYVVFMPKLKILDL